MKGSKNRLTLLELLGAFIILSVVGILDTSLLQQTSAVFRDGNKHTDNFALARISLYLIKQDLGFAVLRSDLIQLPDSADGGSRLAFLAERRGVGTALTPPRFGHRRPSAIECVLVQCYG